MIVYDNPSYAIVLGDQWERMRSRLAGLGSTSDDDARRTLLDIGCIEQAAHDALAPHDDHRAHPFVKRLHTMTAAAARAWLSVGAQRAAEQRTLVQLATTHAGAAVSVTAYVRPPEGFAHYALFPEQYAAAADVWLSRHRPTCRSAVVVGVRSIGTTLAAVVAAKLESTGIITKCITVRPDGHPFQRSLVIEPSRLRRCSHLLIVDEGPGLSGSSMAAVVEAAERAGVARGAMTFLPSHDHGPGPRASEPTRGIWRQVPSIAVSAGAKVFGGRSLPEHLVAQATEQFGGTGSVLPDDDWRAHACGADWPASIPSLIGPRYRARVGDKTMAFEFDGLIQTPGSGESRLAGLRRCARAGFARPPLGSFSGFVARPWLEGRCLTRKDVDASLLEDLARYLTRVARPALDPACLAAAHARRQRWTVHNLAVLFREESATASRCLEPGEMLTRVWQREAVDYDPAPQRWTVLSDGTLQRNGTVGAAHGHTAVGRQPLLWDLAAVLAEWQLGPDAARAFLGRVEQRLGEAVAPGALSAFLLAFHAFKLGALSMVRDCADAPRDRVAIDEAFAYSSNEARRALGGVLLPAGAPN